MTVLAAWANADYLLFGCDSQYGDDTTGLRRSGKKLHQIADLPLLWGLSGNSDLHEVVGLFLDSNIPQAIEQGHHITDIADNIGLFIAQLNKTMLDRAQGVRGRRDSADGVTFMMAGEINEKLQVIHIDWVGSPSIYPNRTTGAHAFISAGSAAKIADSLYQFLSSRAEEGCSLEVALIAMTRILLSTINSANEGVSEPIYLYQFADGKMHEVESAHLARIKMQIVEWEIRESKAWPTQTS